MRFLLTTDPGIEDLAAREVVETLSGAAVQAAPFGVSGQVLVEGGIADSLAGLSLFALSLLCLR